MLNSRESDLVEPSLPEHEHPGAVGLSMPASRSRSLRRPASALALVTLLCAPPASGFEFGGGELAGSFDTTVSHGLTWRVQDRDERLLADINGNDGDYNYDQGIVSNTSKFTSDLELGYRNFGAFARVTGFLDFENENGRRERTALHPDARDLVGRDLEVLDLYATGAFELGDTVGDLRVGKHVLNWGESTFIPNGINAINPFDVSKLRLPGSELREALLPVSLVSLSVAPSDALSVEGFYQLDWEETEIDPVGSYFSTTDYVGPGATRAVIPIPGYDVNDVGFGFGPLTPAINADLAGYEAMHPQLGLVPAPQPLQPELDTTFFNVVRGPDRTPDDSGQWGLAVRYLAEELSYTEFGLYFINYHSRLPLLSARTGSREGIQAGLAAAGAVSASTSHTVAAVTRAVTETATAAVTAEVTAAVQAGLIDPADAPATIAARVRELVANLVPMRVAGIASGLAIDRYLESGHYFIEYPEDIRLVGLSFNTQLGTSGWALQGEYSLRFDAQLQRAEDSLFEEGLAPIVTALGLASDPASLSAYLGGYEPSNLRGHVERNVSQVQATATKSFGPALGADSWVFLTEAALMHVHNMPDRSAMPLESPAGGSLTSADADADATSFGYRMAARLDYNNAIGAVNLFPYAQFRHDVNGNSPSPIGPFVGGLTALTLGVGANYLSQWQANLGWTRYTGRGNELSDRDFVSASISYSF